MPENIEIKARAKDFSRQCQLAQQASGSSGEIILQEDTFFDVARGRLKLRILSASQGELIYYERIDVAVPRKSEYYVAQSSTPKSLETVLCATLHVRGTVKKRRTLYKAGQTRIHMDEVEGLGCFIELEVVLERGQDEAEGMRIAREFMDRLEIAEEDLLAQAYVDLLMSATDSKIRDSKFEIRD
jgi:predicted adenylyl cyclase CyaB